MDILFNAIQAFLVTIFFLVVPLLISSVIIIELMKLFTKKHPELRAMHGTKEFVQYVFSLHVDKGLSSQCLFWLAILTPFSYFILLGLLAWQGYSIRLDAEGFKTFISISALPLGVLSLALPLSASVARFHTTKQTAKQIEIVSQKNNIDLYNSHRKELFGYFQQLGTMKYVQNFTVENKVHPRVYKVYFTGKPSEGVPKVKEESFERVSRLLRIVSMDLIKIINEEDLDIAFNRYIIDFGGNVFELGRMLGIREIEALMSDSPKVPVIITGQNLHLETIGKTTDEAVSAFRCAENFFHNLCDFAGYESDYFKDRDLHKQIQETIRVNGKKNDRDKVIERLHEHHIKRAIDDEYYSKMFPNSPRP